MRAGVELGRLSDWCGDLCHNGPFDWIKKNPESSKIVLLALGALAGGTFEVLGGMLVSGKSYFEDQSVNLLTGGSFLVLGTALLVVSGGVIVYKICDYWNQNSEARLVFSEHESFLHQ